LIAGGIEIILIFTRVPNSVHIVQELIELAAIESKDVTSAAREHLGRAIECYAYTETSFARVITRQTLLRVLELEDDIARERSVVKVFLQKGHHVDDLSIVCRVHHELGRNFLLVAIR